MKAILVLTAALAFALSPLTTAGFNGFRPDQFPVPQIDPPVQPAGYAFSIWGLIYVWLIAGSVFGLLKRDTDPGWDRMRWPLFTSLTVGAVWIPVAQTSPFWATILIWIMLATSVWALLTAGRQDRAWLQAPIALYAGWLTAASCVALALMLAGHGNLQAQTAALIMIGLALLIAMLVQPLRPSATEYSAALIWALFGILVANTDPPNLMVLGLSFAGIVVLAAIALRGLMRKG